MFTPLSSVLKASVLGQYVAVHKLSPVHLQIYLLLYSLCYKGNRIKSMRQISYSYLATAINKMYGTNLNKRTVKYGCDKIVSLGLMDRVTTRFKRQIGTQLLPDKASFYRIHT